MIETAQIAHAGLGILVHVENDEPIAAVMQRHLTAKGVEVQSVANVSEALAFLTDMRVAGFLIDRRLPMEIRPDWAPLAPDRFDAIGLIELIHVERPDVLIAVMTNYPDDDSLAELIDEGILSVDQVWSKYHAHVPLAAERIASLLEANAACHDPEAGFLRCGRHVYRLTRRLRNKSAILSRLTGIDAGADEQTILVQFHSAFQRLYRTPMHERTRQDEDRWCLLSTLVDVERYVADHREPELLVGEITALERGRITIQWYGAEAETFDLLAVHGRLAAAVVGDIVEARIRRTAERDDWVTCLVRPRRQWTPADFEAMPGQEAYPVADWPTAAEEGQE